MAVGLLLAACGPAQLEDGLDSTPELRSATDTGGVSESTAEAAGVLKVASTFSLADLKAKVGLAATVANNISTYRLGDDGISGTADDEVFDTLRELDAVPYVNGPVFVKLLTYARANGYAVGDPKDPFIADNCTGPDISDSDLVALFSPGATERLLTSGATYPDRFALGYQRARSCIGTACTAWSAPGRDSAGDQQVRVLLSKRLAMTIHCGGGYIYMSCDGVGTPLVKCAGYGSDPVCPAVSGSSYQFTGKMTKNCLRLSTQPTGARQNGLLVRF